MTSPTDDALLPDNPPSDGTLLGDEALTDDIPTLQRQIVILEQAIADCDTRVRTLTLAENPAAGIFFAHEIHEARQNKLAYGVSKELRRVRINRLKQGGANGGDSFLFG
ncbi:MAG: hypothetical protein R3Y11_06375 [Pseudomonadota bacterium]